ncbi:MAG: large conductance mechanosensitive channel protein MscL [Gemmatimonadaceae bacterium]
MWADFKAFLIKQNAVALAIAVVIGAALNKVVTAIVDDIVMPIVGYASPGGNWRQATWQVGQVGFKVGDLASAIVNFFIVGFIAWRISKIFIKPDPPKAGAPTKLCPYCRTTVDAAAVRCAACTSQL